MTELELLQSESDAGTRGVSYISGEFLYGPAEVTTRFERVANLENEQGWCVSVGTFDASPGPNMILFGRDEFARMGLEPGEAVEVTPSSVHTRRGRYFYERRAMASLSLDCPTERSYSALIEAVKEYGVGACQYLLHNVDDIPFPEVRVGELAAALPESDSAMRMLGLGNGYTPSGDDVLTGFIVTFVVFIGSIPEFLGGIWDIARTKTTSLAATTMKFASEGLMSSRLARVLGHLSGNNDDLSEAVRDFVQEVGHSSGSDIMLGVVLALHQIMARGNN